MKGTIGTISYVLVDGELVDSVGYALIGMIVAGVIVAVCFGVLYDRSVVGEG